MSNILITGGTGSLGKALIAKWHNEHNITVLSRNPHKQQALKSQYPKVRFILADICNESQVHYACKGQDILVHAAALKIVDDSQGSLSEYERVNVQGSIVAAIAWASTHREPHPISGLEPEQPRRALFVSTDKAVRPVNFYGMTKAIAERIWTLQFGYSAVRYGNVVGSKGSFLDLWQDTDKMFIAKPNPTRFFMTMDKATSLIEAALYEASYEPGLFIPTGLKSFSIEDVAAAYGGYFTHTPLRAGEKQHEELLAPGEGAVPVGDDILERVYTYHPNDDSYYTLYRSDTVEKMTGEEVLNA